jgi:hypothetical protein
MVDLVSIHLPCRKDEHRDTEAQSLFKFSVSLRLCVLPKQKAGPFEPALTLAIFFNQR